MDEISEALITLPWLIGMFCKSRDAVAARVCFLSAGQMVPEVLVAWAEMVDGGAGAEAGAVNVDAAVAGLEVIVGAGAKSEADCLGVTAAVEPGMTNPARAFPAAFLGTLMFAFVPVDFVSECTDA